MVDNGPTDAAAATWGLSHALADGCRSLGSKCCEVISAPTVTAQKDRQECVGHAPWQIRLHAVRKNGHFARYVRVIALKYMYFQ